MTSQQISSLSKAIVLLLVVVQFASCRQAEEAEEIDHKQLQTRFSLERYNEQDYIGIVDDIKYDSPYYYFADNLLSSIFVLDSAFEFVGKFGREGRGPGEFLGLNNLSIVGDQILTSGFRSGRLDVFDRHTFEFIERVSLPDGCRMPFGNFYADQDHNVSVFLTRDDGVHLALVNLKSGDLSVFQGYTFDPDDMHMVGFLSGDLILAVDFFSPEIISFSLSDLRHLQSFEVPIPGEVINNWAARIRESQGRGRTPFYGDAYFADGSVFLRYPGFGGLRSGIAEVKARGRDLVLSRILHRDSTTVMNQICIVGDAVVTFNILDSSIGVKDITDTDLHSQ